MRIGIDCRLWNETGVGRYIRALTTELARIDKRNEYVLFFKQSEYKRFSSPNFRWHKFHADISWHSLAEQIVMPVLYQKANLDLVHIPYFSVPLFTPIPMVVTLHDLTISQTMTGKATTLPWPIYSLKRLGYRFVLSHAVKTACKIITVSKTVRQQIVTEYPDTRSKIVVTYEAGTLESSRYKLSISKPDKYLLYVGNAHPHKNLRNLVEAFLLLRKYYSDLQLVLVGKLDFFYSQLSKLINKYGLANQVFLAGGVDNRELRSWYKHAAIFVFPSFAEGFGIPGLEAMTEGCAVVASDLPVFHEIYKNGALYFNPHDPINIANTINSLLQDPKKKQSLISQGFHVSSSYSWQKMATETLSIYESCNSI